MGHSLWVTPRCYRGCGPRGHLTGFAAWGWSSLPVLAISAPLTCKKEAPLKILCDENHGRGIGWLGCWIRTVWISGAAHWSHQVTCVSAEKVVARQENILLEAPFPFPSPPLSSPFSVSLRAKVLVAALELAGVAQEAGQVFVFFVSCLFVCLFVPLFRFFACVFLIYCFLLSLLVE